MGLRRDEVDIEQARFWLRWLENGLSVGQPLGGDELRAIKRYLATRADRLPWLLAGLDVLPGRYGNAGRLCHRADRHSSRCSANTAATGMALWAALTVVAVVGLVGLVWVVFALVVLALVAGV